MTTQRYLITLMMGGVLLACSTANNTPEPPIEDAQPGKISAQPRATDKPDSPTLPENEPAPAIAYQQPTEEMVKTAQRVTLVNAASEHPAGMARMSFRTADRDGSLRMASEPLDRENYTHFDNNPVHLVSEDPVSTFSIDVDTASYSNLRRLLNQGRLPRQDAIRVEELINYFSYDYPTPAGDDTPFSVFTEIGPSPWHADRQLLHIGIKGFELTGSEIPDANLVFLIDVSGSMRSPNKLELLKTSMKLLVKQLDADDKISIAVYAGAAGRVLEPTSGAERGKIIAAINQLTAGGSTNGGAGIRLAYAMAEEAFIDGGVNRVILATDGDFNVGTTDLQALKDLVTEKRKSGVALTVLGFGGGNYNDALMQEIAQIGNGNAAYIDTINEARKVLVDELVATLNIIAKDVKIQVEFNPSVVSEYRLIGYETRHLNREDFNNDKVDAGDIGAGHTVTAIYELTLAGSRGLIDPLRYGEGRSLEKPADAEVAFLKLRHKAPNSDTSKLINVPIYSNDIRESLANTSQIFRFSAAVAGFGQLLRGGDYTDEFSYQALIDLANEARGKDPFGYRGEFITLVRTADALTTPPRDAVQVGQRQE
ncbi:MAG: VWA domain-containing protein [Gammaproteobacteria bacterium]|nr:VWA domain-containing protein [Gammaproteobacteria bacterium]